VEEVNAAGSESLCRDRQVPPRRNDGLRQQLRRAAVSVPSNIAEGQARYSHREFLRFIGLARGSLVEGETQIYLARALGYMDRKTAKDLLIASEEVGRIINGLRESLQKKLQAKISQDR